jgi:glycosyltransferase involved in cell wall biosynthesis
MIHPLIISTSDIDGGASRAAYRLHAGFQSIGVTSKMVVRAKLSRNKAVVAQQSLLTKLGPMMSRRPLQKYPNRDRTLFSAQWFPDAIAASVQAMNPDVVNLHWVCNGFLQIETLKSFKRPLVWTLQDMWPMTGGCHYSADCDRYQASCGNCPQLKSNRENDLSRHIWQRKQRSWQSINLTIVTPSHWMTQCVQASTLFKNSRVETIPFCLDTEVYRPHAKSVARQVLNLPQDKQIIVFGALAATSDKRKGFDLLVEALRKLSQTGMATDVEVAVFGASAPETPVNLGFKTHYLGHLNDDLSLSLAYSAGDVMIVPSLQESFGQTASEALACGTPVAAFNATGLMDIVNHGHTGYLAQPYSTEDLAQGIAWILADSDRLASLVSNARIEAMQRFNLKLQAEHYVRLFEDLIKK